VLDEEAVARSQGKLARLRQRQEEQEQRAEEVQERDLRGEQRARIDYRLGALSDTKIKQRLGASCKTVEGLRAMAVLFPESIMPTPQTKWCVRCKKHYDDRYDEEKVCRLEHRSELCNTVRYGSFSWEHCLRCTVHFEDKKIDQLRFEGKHTQDDYLSCGRRNGTRILLTFARVQEDGDRFIQIAGHILNLWYFSQSDLRILTGKTTVAKSPK
jgi:hypothetical protein